MIRFLSFLCVACFVSSAQAKPEKVGIVTTDLGSGFSCSLEGAELVCQKTSSEIPAPVTIVITSRTRTSDESIATFKKHLSRPREFSTADGGKVSSEVKSVKTDKIGEHFWIDALHFQSEVPGFYTRYYATIVGKNSIVATFTMKKELFESFDKTVPKIVSGFKFSEK